MTRPQQLALGGAELAPGRRVQRRPMPVKHSSASMSQQGSLPSLAAFPICAPRRRLPCYEPGGAKGKSPPRSSLVVYVPGAVDQTDLFAEVFRPLGAILVPR
jgi:hypothetical protein